MEDKADEEEEKDDEAADDEELNELLKRSDQEATVFEKMDAERQREERKRLGGRGKKYERLIQEDELPEVYRLDEMPVEDATDPLSYGRGQRSRDSVRYDDGLTEEQWLNASTKREHICALGLIYLVSLYLFFLGLGG